MKLILYIMFSLSFCDIKIVSEFGMPDDRFGRDVSLSNEWIAVGANRDDNENGSNAGSIYVYRYDDLEIIDEFFLVAPDGESNDYFGKTVSVYQNWLITSSIYDNVNGEKSGSAYLFNFNGESWVFHTKIVPEDGSPFDRFGYSLDIYDDQVIIGSVYDDDLAENAGSAYVYELLNEQWVFKQKLKLDSPDVDDFFGISVSISSNLIAVGAVNDDDIGLNSGSVILFKKNNNEWEQFYKVLAFDGSDYDLFGNDIDLNLRKLVVGSFHDDNFYNNSGSVYLYEINQDYEVLLLNKITSFDESPNDNFGYSVSLSDNYFAVGSKDNDNGINSGAVYIYDFVNDFNQFKYIPDDGEAFDEFGVSVCIYENKVIVGSQHSNNSNGAVYLSNIKNCNNILACNYNNGLLNDDSGCEFPINNYDCSGSCFYEIDNCGVCNGQNLKGDVNYDSIVDIVDVVFIVDYILLSNFQDLNTCMADINFDLIVNITDLILIIEFILES